MLVKNTPLCSALMQISYVTLKEEWIGRLWKYTEKGQKQVKINQYKNQYVFPRNEPKKSANRTS